MKTNLSLYTVNKSFGIINNALVHSIQGHCCLATCIPDFLTIISALYPFSWSWYYSIWSIFHNIGNVIVLSSLSKPRVQFGKKLGSSLGKKGGLVWEYFWQVWEKQGVQFGKLLFQFGKTGGLVWEIFTLVWENFYLVSDFSYLVDLHRVYLVWDY